MLIRVNSCRTYCWFVLIRVDSCWTRVDSCWLVLLLACVCTCLCVCLYCFTVKASSVCNDVWDILERYRSTILCWEYYSSCFCQCLLYLRFHKCYVSPPKTKLQQLTNWRKINMIYWQAKRWYIDIGYKSASIQKEQVTKIY